MHLLLEQITFIPQLVEGDIPRWQCTRPTDQFAVGVWTWRRINGAWSAGLVFSDDAVRNNRPFNAMRVRLIVNDWPGFPTHMELYDVIGEPEPVNLAERLAQTEQLLGALKKANTKP